MTQGPIEFGTAGRETLPAGEFSGGSGLIQPAKTPRGTDGHVDESLTESEKLGMMARAAGEPLSLSEQVTGVPDVDGVVVDPATGRVLPADVSTAGGAGSGELSSLKP